MAFMHSAMISCVITGTDWDKSTVYMFAENRFDDKDSVQYIQQLYEESEHWLLYDPLTRGFLNADQPIRDPQELFLFVLRVRIHEIHYEYIQARVQLEQSFDRYEPVLVRYILSCKVSCLAFYVSLTTDI